MTDKLTLYNLALGHLKQRRIGTLTEAVDARRTLDDFYAQVLGECLEDGLWNFALRAIQIDASDTLVPGFGWKYGFVIPSDWDRTVILSSVETFYPPLWDYQEEAGVWYANFTPLYARYVSNDATYGMNLGAWSATYTNFVALALAAATCTKITGSEELLAGEHGLLRRLNKARIKAKSNDAMNEPPGTPPTGTWALSRRGFQRGVPSPGGSGPNSFDD